MHVLTLLVVFYFVVLALNEIYEKILLMKFIINYNLQYLRASVRLYLNFIFDMIKIKNSSIQTTEINNTNYFFF